jgi:branched-chain amino acid transport system permease protein
MTLLVQQLVNGLAIGCVYVMVAVAFTLTIGILNFLNFTIPTLFMIAAMVAWAATSTGYVFSLPTPLPWPVALAVGIAVAIIASLVIERFTFRYLKAKHGDATEHAIPLVSSLGFVLILQNLVQIAVGADTHRFVGPGGSFDVNIGGVFIKVAHLVVLGLVALLVFALTWLLKRTGIGRALRAIAENPDAASVLGIDITRIVPVVFMLTGLLCGLAGTFFAVSYGDVSPLMGDEIGTKAIAGMVVGGLGSVWGAVIGGLLVGITETMTIHFYGSDAVQIAVWGLLLLVLLVRPRGLLGHAAIGLGKL